MKLRNAGPEVVCDPVWPNEGVIDWYERQLRTYLLTMTDEIQTGIALDFARGTHTIGAAADRSPFKDPLFADLPFSRSQSAMDAASVVSLVQKRMDAWAKKWTKSWDTMSDTIAERFATKARNATDTATMASFKKAGFTVRFKLTRNMRDSYKAVVQTQVELIRSIPAQYLKDVRTAVWANLTTGGGDMEALRIRIQDIYGIADRRASFIARDQTNKAKAVFEEARRHEVGVEEAIWQHSNAGQEKYKRVTHVEASQQRIRYRIKEGWLDPATGKRIWPGTEIGCRCTSRAIIPGQTRTKYYSQV